MANESRTGMKVAAVGIGIIIIIAAVAVGLFYLGQKGEQTVNPGTPPPEMVTYADDWPLPNKDYSNSRATTSSSINSGNVDTLGLAWSYGITGLGLAGGGTSNPIINGDTVYFQDGACNIFALNLSTGAVKWSRMINAQAIVGPVGPVVAYGKVFAMRDLYNMTALDSGTGAVQWTTRVSSIPTTGIDIAPVAYDGMVYISSVPGTGDQFYAPGGIGVLYGLDQQTGEIKWNATTVKDNNLWGHPEVNSGGGAWYPPAIDTETGYMFWGIGNPAPFPGAPGFPSGSSYQNESLYADCVMTLDHNNGKLKWYTQAILHDIWDHDLQISPILASANVAGVQQDLVLASGKAGEVFAMNRDTGAILWKVLVGEHQNDTIDPITKEMWIEPGALGGVETPMAYLNGILYVPVVNWPMLFNETKILGSQMRNGELVAIDVRYGHIIWNQTLPTPNFGAATVVNDLVFTASFDGTIFAFNRLTGEQLWTYSAPAGINGWPAVAGDTIVWPCGSGGTPSLIALRLGATPPGPSVRITSPTTGSAVQGPNVTISVSVSNFNVVDKLGQPNVAGEGHIHYFMDVNPPTTPGQPAVTASGTYAATVNTTYTWTNVTNGSHMFSVELVNNDHTPLVPPVVAFVNVTVGPSVVITSPTEGATITGPDVTISIQVSNFALVDKLGQANVPGEGHVHYFMDVDPPTTPGVPAVTASGTYAATIATSYTWTNVTPGNHMFSVELINNDHTPLVPPVVAFVNVTVTAPVTSAVVYLKAQNVAFNVTTITVPAGASVTVHFQNMDSGVPHNFAVYTDSSATTLIFRGSTITGVSSITYTFTAPATPGTYFFRCDVHPTLMTGNFVVT